MARILALDFGRKRTGVAATDPEQIIAVPLETVDTDTLIGYLKKYMMTEPVERVVVGYPLALDGSPTDATPMVDKFIGKYENVFPNIPIEKWEERFSSKMAEQALTASGINMKKQKESGMADRTPAVLILQNWMEGHKR